MPDVAALNCLTATQVFFDAVLFRAPHPGHRRYRANVVLRTILIDPLRTELSTSSVNGQPKLEEEPTHDLREYDPLVIVDRDVAAILGKY